MWKCWRSSSHLSSTFISFVSAFRVSCHLQASDARFVTRRGNPQTKQNKKKRKKYPFSKMMSPTDICILHQYTPVPMYVRGLWIYHSVAGENRWEATPWWCDSLQLSFNIYWARSFLINLCPYLMKAERRRETCVGCLFSERRLWGPGPPLNKRGDDVG